MRKSSALWHTSVAASEVKEAVLPPIESGYCLVQSQYSLVSTGTERLVATGQVPTSLHEAMAVPYMAGKFSLPIKYGYSLVGQVAQGSPNLRGKTVHLLHPHQTACVVREADVLVIPEGIPPLRATLVSNLETALTALWDAEVMIGDRVLVVGFGMIGALVARLLRMMPAVDLAVYDTDPRRAARAERMGFATVPEIPNDFDIAFHSSSSEAGLQTSIEAVGLAGKVVELSWYGTQTVNIHLGGSFHQQRKQIISSQVSSLPPHRQMRWDFRRRKEVVLALLRNEDFDQHITEVVPFDQLSKLFDRIRSGDRTELGWGVRY